MNSGIVSGSPGVLPGLLIKAPPHAGGFGVVQFENPLNVEDHEHTTGQEILRQVPGVVDAFMTEAERLYYPMPVGKFWLVRVEPSKLKGYRCETIVEAYESLEAANVACDNANAFALPGITFKVKSTRSSQNE